MVVSYDPWGLWEMGRAPIDGSPVTVPETGRDISRKSKYTTNHPRTHSDFRSRDLSISVAWEILVTNQHVVFSWADRSRTLFSNMLYVLWLIFHILWSVKRDHLIEHILVLVYCHSHDNNRLGTFRIVFLLCLEVLLSKSRIW